MKNKINFTVLVASLGNSNSIFDFLESLNNSGYFYRQDTEIIIVCGAQEEQNIKKVEGAAKKYGARYFYDKRMTKPYCMNTGIKNARGNFIAFTDDDVIVTDKYWLEKFYAKFVENNKLGYVSGNVIGYNTETTAANLWERKGGLSKGARKRYWSRKFLKSFKYNIFPWPLHKMCAGANCMISMTALRRVGPYNVLLETPYIPHGSTLDIGYKIAKQGFELLYDPDIYLYHKHPVNMTNIKNKLFNYGIGDTAVYMNFFVRFNDFRSLWWALFGHACYTLKKIIKSLFGLYPLPITYLMYGLYGNVIGWIRFINVYFLKNGRTELNRSYKEFYE